MSAAASDGENLSPQTTGPTAQLIMEASSCHPMHWLKVLARSLAGIPALLGAGVLVCWAIPSFRVPLSLSTTTLGEPVAAIGLILCSLGSTSLGLPIRWAEFGGGICLLLGLETLVSILWNLDSLGVIPSEAIHRLVRPGFYISVSTALCLLAQGTSLFITGRNLWTAHQQTIRVLGSSIAMSLSLASLLGNLYGFQESSPWAVLFAIKPPIAAGFLTLSLGEIIIAWLASPKGAYHVPGWAPSLAGVFLFTGTFFFWQAALTRNSGIGNNLIDYTTVSWMVLGIGSALSVLVIAGLFSAQIAKAKASETTAINRQLSEQITERCRIEQSLVEERNRLRALIESLPQGVYFKDLNSTYLMVNPSYARDVGKEPAAMIGRQDRDLFPPTVAENLRADDQRVASLRQLETIEETRLLPSGERRIIEITKCPVTDQHDQIIGLLGIQTNVTERKETEMQLKAFAAKLERSNHELQDFAYVASHDLQEPLRKVAIFGNRLLTKCAEQLAPEGCDYLERILNATKRMQNLINDLLSYSRASTQLHPFAPVNLTEVLKEVATDLEARVEESQAKIEIGELPTLEADLLQMRQLFQNLVGNALKFRKPESPPHVRIQGTLVSNSEVLEAGPMVDYCQITVADNGIGFDQKYADRIFHVFQRLHNRSQFEGCGVGLAICRKIVERHGGSITAKSAPGEGATFILCLPTKQTTNHPLYEQNTETNHHPPG
jgi:two-component system, LuxR family, sensor kinase FixL